MIRYLETFYRHRLILVAPVVLVLLISVSIVYFQPRAYDATSKLWVDKDLLGTTAVDTSFSAPADTQVAVLQELLKTRSFAVKVAARGPLVAALLSRRAAAAKDPVAQLSNVVQGKSTSNAPLTQEQQDDLVYTTISAAAKADSSGPNIVTVTYQDADPDIAAAVAQGIVDQFIVELLSNQRAQAATAADFYTGQVKSAEVDLSAKDAAVYNYLTAHPEQQLASAIPDLTVSQLRRDDDLARTRYESMLSKLDNANLQAQLANDPTPSGLRVIDPALSPRRPVSRTTQLLEAGGAGLISGLGLMLLCLVVLTLADTSLRHPAEVETMTGLTVAGDIPQAA
jgi:uncharacterized protein involved in exopolysaccharide biosynthesis